MADLIRDAPIGQLIRYFTSNRVLQYPEEKPGFECPTCYSDPEAAAKAQKASITSPSSTSAGIGADDPVDDDKAGVEPTEPAEPTNGADRAALERLETSHSHLERAETAKDLERRETLRETLSRVGTRATLAQTHTRADLEAAFSAASIAKEPTRPVIPQRTSDGTILVDWYTTDVSPEYLFIPTE